MAHIYGDGYLKGASKDTLAKVAKDKFTDQATRDKAKALLEQKSGGSSGGSGTSSGSGSGSKSGSTATAPGKLIPQGSGTTPGGSTAPKTTGSTGTKMTGGTGGASPSPTWLKSVTGSSGILDPSTLSDDQLNAWAAENSKLWHSNPENRSKYEAENKAIKALLDKRNGTTSTLDPTSGKWTTTGGGSSSLLTGPLPGGGDTSALWKGGLTTPPETTQPSHQILQEPTQPPTEQIDYGALLAQLQQYIDQAQASTPQYEPSQWEKTAEALAQAALGMQYEDWTQSGQYAALADRYGLQGRQSMQDMLGQVSSRTGGLASSYATTAAQQQYNDYMSRLEEVARQMYAGERSDAIQNAQLAGQYSDRDYGRYLDKLSQYNRDRSFGFDVLSQALSQSNYQQEWQNKLDQQAYERQRDALADSRYDDQLAYERGQDQYEDFWRWREDFQQRVEYLLSMGVTVEELYSQYSDLVQGSGYNELELRTMAKAAADALAASGVQQGGGQLRSAPQSEPPAPETEEFRQSPGYGGIVRAISEIEDRALRDEAKINQIVWTIQNAQGNGVISEAEARTLLRQYGLEG